MKIITILMLVLSIVSTVVMADVKYLTKEKIFELSKSSKFLSNAYTRIIEGIDEDNTYFLNVQHKGKIVNCFVDKNTGSIYMGERYDATGKKSQFTKSSARIARLKQSVNSSVSFSYGTGKKDLYLFTDPECIYCKKFEIKAKGLLGDYTMHVILYPLRFHKNAPAMIEWIMQGLDDKEKHERAEAIMVHNSQEYKLSLDKKKPFKYSSTVNSNLSIGKNAARLLRVTGTPTMFDSEFHKLNWGLLLQQERRKKQKSTIDKK